MIFLFFSGLGPCPRIVTAYSTRLRGVRHADVGVKAAQVGCTCKAAVYKIFRSFAPQSAARQFQPKWAVMLRVRSKIMLTSCDM
ncbi:hypothetical protein BJV74DRAFT_21832 [Russula compacta]|nr:hypothetical protein BJV74DRAFT_21832 [Russula compacta]